MNIWKLGTKWGTHAPSFYEYIKEKEIIISDINDANPQKGDYMLIADGFTVLAIAVLLKDVQAITTNPDLKVDFQKFGIPYVEKIIYAPAKFKILSSEEQFKYETIKGIVKISSKATIKQTLTLMGEMVAIHQNCLAFLEDERQKNSSLFFRLRQQNNQQRLEKGYWFWGNEDYCLISFWQGDDTLAKVPNIHIKIDIMNRVSLVLTATDNPNKAQFMQKIAGLIGDMQQQKQKSGLANHWEKYYDQYQNESNRYIYILQDFISREKEIIDAFLLLEKNKKNNTLGNLDIIKEEVFGAQYGGMKKYKDNFKFDPFVKVSNTKNETNHPIHLKSMKLENIGHFTEIELDLNHRIICLLGYNGTGKTTLLRALALGLSGIDDNPEIDTMESGLQGMLRIGVASQKGNLEHPFVGQITINYELDKPYTNTLELKKETGMFSVSLSNDFRAEGDSFGFSNGNNQYKQLLLGFAQLQSNSENGNNTTFSTMQPNVYDILPLLYNKEDNRFKSLGEWIMQIDADSQSNTKNEKTLLAFIFEVLSKIMQEKIVLDKIEHQEGRIWLKVNEQQVLYELLSQGFKNVFAWVGHLIRRLYESSNFKQNFYESPAIVLIDEIDTYLHPKWQRKILDILAEEFPKAQFIVTTHSPLVASHVYAEGEKAVVYIIQKVANNDLEEGATPQYEAVEYTQTYGRDIRSVFFDWMHIEERDKDVQKTIDEIFDWIDEETKESVQKAEEGIKKLDLPLTDPIMVKLKFSLDLAKENLFD